MNRDLGPIVFRSKADRALAAIVGGGLFLQGAAELIVRLDEPMMPLFFWLPTLWGGAALVLVGSFRASQSRQLSKALVILGACLGFVPSAWTILMPLLLVALVVRTVASKGESQAAVS